MKVLPFFVPDRGRPSRSVRVSCCRVRRHVAVGFFSYLCPDEAADAAQTNDAMRYFLELSYDGSAYCGWQRQPEQPSVQQTLERALSTLLRQPIAVTGAGRTDTGVHALYYVAHFDVLEVQSDPDRLLRKANALLPADIALGSITPVADEAHARFSAREREYRYFIEPRKNPFTRHAAWQFPVPLDMERMNEAAAVLLDTEEFTSFAKLHSNNKNDRCRVMKAEWELLPDGMLRFTIRADRFLRNMVRAVVGTLVDVGRGRYTPAQFDEIVRSRDLSRSSGGAPAQGLYLSDVRYPSELFVRRMRLGGDDA